MRHPVKGEPIAGNTFQVSTSYSRQEGNHAICFKYLDLIKKKKAMKTLAWNKKPGVSILNIHLTTPKNLSLSFQYHGITYSWVCSPKHIHAAILFLFSKDSPQPFSNTHPKDYSLKVWQPKRTLLKLLPKHFCQKLQLFLFLIFFFF